MRHVFSDYQCKMVQGVKHVPNITLGSDALTTSSKFTYLGSIITQNLSQDDEPSCRVGKLQRPMADCRVEYGTILHYVNSALRDRDVGALFLTGKETLNVLHEKP